MAFLESWAAQIQRAEGWAPGSRSYRNNNPGNLKFAHQPGAIGADMSGPASEAGSAIFPDYATGWAALLRQLGLYVQRYPQLTLAQVTAIYAPGAPAGYLQTIASGLGVSASAQLGVLAGTIAPTPTQPSTPTWAVSSSAPSSAPGSFFELPEATGGGAGLALVVAGAAGVLLWVVAAE